MMYAVTITSSEGFQEVLSMYSVDKANIFKLLADIPEEALSGRVVDIQIKEMG